MQTLSRPYRERHETADGGQLRPIRCPCLLTVRSRSRTSEK
ncbi:hypothetical protein ACVLD2_004004 [Paenibacillus sp. PvR052]